MKGFKKYIAIILFLSICLVIGFNLDKNSLDLNLTPAEQAFLEKNPSIILAPDPDFAPVEFYDDNGEFKGIVSDFVKYINENTKLNIEVVRYKIWDDVMKAISRQEVDMLGAVSISEGRKEFLLFSDSYISIPNVFVSQNKDILINNEDFSEITIAVVNNSAKHDLMKEKYPNAKIVPMENIQEGLENVALGNVDVYLGSLAQICYYMDQYKFVNLEIIKELDQSLDYSYPIHFAVQKDDEILQSILNKILRNMPSKKKNEIINNWMDLNTSDFYISKDSMIKSALVFSIIVLLALIIIYFLRFEVRRRTDEIRKLNLELTEQLNISKKKTNEIALAMINLIEIHDDYTNGHSKNVAFYTKGIAEELGFEEVLIEEAYFSALLHDLGKALVPNAIIKKKDKLTNKEFNTIKKHSLYSYQILSNMEEFESIATNVLYHHERYDGNGYPNAITGEKIPIISRIIAVADAFDAMTTTRTYRKRISVNEALKELENCSGTQFDEKIVKVFIKMVSNGFLNDELISENSIN